MMGKREVDGQLLTKTADHAVFDGSGLVRPKPTSKPPGARTAAPSRAVVGRRSGKKPIRENWVVRTFKPIPILLS